MHFISMCSSNKNAYLNWIHEFLLMGLFDKFSKTFDKFGYDMDGYDKNGYDKKGYNKNGYR